MTFATTDAFGGWGTYTTAPTSGLTNGYTLNTVDQAGVGEGLYAAGTLAEFWAYALGMCQNYTGQNYLGCLNGISDLSGGQTGGFADCLSIGGVTYGCGGIVWTNPILPTSFAPFGPLALPFAPTPGPQSSPSCNNPNQHPVNVSSNGATWTCVDNPTPTLNVPAVPPLPIPIPPVPPRPPVPLPILPSPMVATSSPGLAPTILLAGQRIF